MMWFVPLSPRYAGDWFIVVPGPRCCESDAATLRLLRRNPFPDGPPDVVRARLFRYRYSTWRERRATGRWWDRTLAAEYVPPFGLADVGATGEAWGGERPHGRGRRRDRGGRDRRRLRPERARRGDHAGSGGSPVTVLEAADEPGGGSRSAELTLPGFVHDVCSSIHVFGRISPFFADLQPALAAHGLRWIRPPAALGHPLDDGSAVLLRGGVDETARGLGGDGDAYRDLFGWMVDAAPTLLPDLLGPFHVPLSPPRALRMARFGLLGLQPATRVARRFRGDAARALLRGDRRPLDPAVDRAG